MKFNDIIEEASQEIVQQFNNFYDKVSNIKELENYGHLRIREIYPSRKGYNMQFHLKPKYAELENSNPEIKYIMRLLKDIAIKYNSQAKVKRENTTNNQAVIKIIFKENLPKETKNEIPKNTQRG
ncbi:MAG: hypothetical protein ACOC3V_05295 [bacterium]